MDEWLREKQSLDRKCENWEQLKHLYKKMQGELQQEMRTRKNRFEQDAMFFQKSTAAINMQQKIQKLLYQKQVPQLEAQIDQMLLRINKNIGQIEEQRIALQMRIQRHQST